MTTAAAIRAAIVAKLSGIDDIGVVHSFERYAVDEDTFRSLYIADGKLLGWFVKRDGLVEKPINDTAGDVETRWTIRGFMGLSDVDQSELVFDELIEKIRDAFRADDRLGGEVVSCTTLARAGIEIVSVEPVMFANTLAHGATLGLTTKTLNCVPEDMQDGSWEITTSLKGDAPQTFGGQV